MLKSIIVADNLTGANATGSLLKKTGLMVASLFELGDSLPRHVDAVAYSTDTRRAEPEDSYAKVKAAFDKLKGMGWQDVYFNKRIDSTLRGNIGVELDAALDSLGDDYTAVVVPAYPDSHRIVVNRTMLVNGALITTFDAGHRQKKRAIKTDDVEQIIGAHTHYPYTYITLGEVDRGADHLATLLAEKAKEARIIILDAVRNKDIVTIAKATVQSGLKALTVDPGPFTMYYLREQQRRENTAEKVLMVIGSIAETTRQQIEYILRNRPIHYCQMDVGKFFDYDKRLMEMERCVSDILAALDGHEFFMLTTAPLEMSGMLDLDKIAKRMRTTTASLERIIFETLTETAAQIMERTDKIDGLLSSGGDVTVALLKQLGAVGVNIREEVIPLAVYGRIMGGMMENKKLVTKGGTIGYINALDICLKKIVNDI